jgi:hypothetical protein
MRFFRNVYQDLVERRLLPLAVLLALALVAVPLTLAKSMPSTEATAATGAAPELDIPSAVPAVSLTSPDKAGRLNHLKALNPFEQRHKPHFKAPKTVAATTSTATAPPSSAASSPVASAGASVGSPSPAPSTPAPSSGSSAPAPSRPATPHRRYVVASLQVRFGPIGSTGGRRNLDRLSPLPGGGSPAVIYLGLLGDRKTAVFLVSSDVRAEGDGRCMPSPRNCQTLRMRAGDTEFFDQSTSHGVNQFQLDVVTVPHRQVSSARAAQKMKARVSRRGQRIERHSRAFRARAAVSHVLRYDKRAGVLVARHRRR